MEARELKLKQQAEEKKRYQKEMSAQKLEQTKKKLAESSQKRELALKQQKDTIERKIELNKVRAIELKN